MGQTITPEIAMPIVYLSTDHNRWRVIANGQPICPDKANAFEAMRAADSARLEIAPIAWNGDRSVWVSTSTIQGL